MNWEKCIAEKTIKKIEPDKERVRNMLQMTDIRQEFWDSLSVIIDDKYSSILVEGYYEVIKELLTAYLNLNEFESSNHECLIRYVKNYILLVDSIPLRWHQHLVVFDAQNSTNHQWFLSTTDSSLITYDSGVEFCCFQKQNPKLNFEAEKIDELRQIRNKIDYRGFFVKKEFFERNKLEYQHIIKLLKKINKRKDVILKEK